MSHLPVLLAPILELLLPAERVLDGTLGAGGHSAALLENGAGALLGLDVDPQALALARERLAPFGVRAHSVHASYATMREQAAAHGWQQVDSILLDLGVSSMQLDTAERGFAFMKDGALDMRFNPTEARPTAADLVNTWTADELAAIFWRYGEEQHSRPLARAIVAGRPYATTRDLASLIERVAPRQKGAKIHPATRIFQALRIAVNDELRVVEQVIPQALALLRSGGRLGIISFHSLEDRLVKQAFKLACTDCVCPPQVPVCVCGHHAIARAVTHKPLVADTDEVAANPRSRSAKLRVVERL